MQPNPKQTLKKESLMAEGNTLKKSLDDVRIRIQEAKKKRCDEIQNIEPRLVAVSKTKPLDLIFEAYEAGQRHFGENYAQELISKATDPLILEKCPDIKWHFIGHLQSNKAAKIATLPNLFMIETVHSQKLAKLLNEAIAKHSSSNLNVYVQVNTSAEDEKSGVLPADIVSLCKFVVEECIHLKFRGLMTIGKYGYDTSLGLNPDFLTLVKCKETICKEMNLSTDLVELSMGMSDDFEHAIELGSSNVRVGSLIFGQRQLKSK